MNAIAVQNRGEARLGGFGALLTGNVFSRGVGLFKLLIFAPLLGPTAYGAFRLASTASAILSSLAGLGLHSSFVRYLPETDSAPRALAFIKRTVGLALAGGLIASVVLTLLREPLGRLIFSEDGYAWLTAIVTLGIPIVVLTKCLTSASKGLRRFSEAAVAEAGQNTGALALAIVAFWVFGPTSESAFGGYVAGSLLAGAWLLPRVRRNAATYGSIPPGIEKPEVGPLVGRALRFSVWYAVIPLFQYLFDFMDRWALARFHDLEITGVYSLIPVIAGGMTVFSLALGPVVQRQATALAAGYKKAESEDLIWGGIAIVLAGSLVYVLVVRTVEPVLWAIIGGKWADGRIVMPILLTYFTFFNIYWIVGAFAALREATWVHFGALCAGSVFNIGLNLLWVPEFAMLGAAWATLVSMLVPLTFHLIFAASCRIAIPRRAFLAFLVPLIGLAPYVVLVPGILVVLALCLWTNWIMTEADRELLREMIRHSPLGGTPS